MTIAILSEKRIVLGVTGSIACYKAVDLASKLAQAGALVDVVLTDSAKHFVSPLSFRSVTGRPVYDDMWNPQDHVQHIQLGETADLLVLAPATAHTIAKMAQGLADNLLTLIVLAARCPVLIAPAMDGGMYGHPATQANVALLKDRGNVFAGPAEGRMASGLSGLGRLLEPEQLLGYIRLVMGQQGPLRGRKVVVTAGPTREPVDPVRFLSNRSTGKQGLALAQAAVDAGGQVTLVTGPTSESLPVGAKNVPVETADEMCQAVMAEIAATDVLLMAAAVSDFRPVEAARQKIKKTAVDPKEMIIPLARNPDILAEVKAQKATSGRPRVTLGFAAETEKAIEYGRDKLLRKGLDFIAVNDVSAADAGFAVETNHVTLLGANGLRIELPLQSKTAVAEQIIDHVTRAIAY